MHENSWGPPIRWRDVVPSAEAQLEDEVREQVRAERRARRVEAMKAARNALLDAYGEDIYEDGTVVSFKKRFKCGSHEYVFAAVKAAGKWFTSGMAIGQGRGFEWDDFIEALVNDVPATDFTMMVPADS